MDFKVTFHLDGSGVCYDPNEPIHLDALIAWALAPRQNFRHLQRDELPGEINLPLNRRHIGGDWVWCASALMPEGVTAESMQYWRKRFRQGRAELTDGSPNLTNGTYRDWQMPVPLLLCHRLVAYASGSRTDVKKLLRDVRSLGKKRAHGHGQVIRMDFDEVDTDRSIFVDDVAARWLPDTSGTRLVRPRPPYWHPHGRVRCCEVGTARRRG